VETGAGHTLLWFGGNTKNNKVYNNTIIGSSLNPSSTFNPCIISSSLGGDVYKNNICVYYSQVFATQWADDPAQFIDAMDSNIFYNFNTPDPGRLIFGSTAAYSLAQWQALGFDANSKTADPKLDASYHLTDGSSAIGAGANLTSIGIIQLNSDKDRLIRPMSGPWDIGAFEYVEGRDTTPPAVPTGLSVN